MPYRNAASIVSFVSEDTLVAVQQALDGPLYSFVEYDADAFNPIYVSDATLNFYEDEAQMEAHFAEIHGHVNLDFMEMDLFRNTLFPISERVRYMTTCLDYLKLLRVYGDEEGVFIAIRPDEPVGPVVGALESFMEE